MNATSVGFMPNREKMVFGDFEKGEPRVTFKEQELLELSLVSIPANPAAMLTQRKSFDKAVEDEVIDELEKKDLEIWMKDLGIDFDKCEIDPCDHFIDGILHEDEEEPEEEKVIEETEEKIADDINRNETKCISCGKEIQCLCEKCMEEKKWQDYAIKFYNDIMFKKEEDSAE
jgi:hypothetical protein